MSTKSYVIRNAGQYESTLVACGSPIRTTEYRSVREAAADVAKVARAEIVAGASRWHGTAVRIVEGDRWEARLPEPPPGCTTDVYVGWASPDDPMLVGELADVLGVGIASCGVRYVGIVHGRVTTDRLARVVGHELGHAMGLDHVGAGVMAPNVGDVAEVASADDWREFCAVHRCTP